MTTQWNKIYKLESVGFTSVLGCWPQIVKFFKKNKVVSILDLGCGTGYHMLELSKCGFDMTGFDISREGIDIAKRRFVKNKMEANFKVGSMHNRFPFSNNSFDAIISLRTINHGVKSELECTIEEIYRVTRPKGYLFLTVIKIFGRKKKVGFTKLNRLPVEIIAPYTYRPTVGKEIGITHFMFNKQLLRKMFKRFRIHKIWIETGKRQWERYYCMLAQKRI